MFTFISELREVIGFLEPRPGRPLASGYVPSDWRSWATAIRAKVEVQGAAEGTLAGGREARITGRITIRFDPTRNPVTTEKVTWGNRVLNIDAVRDALGTQKQLELDFTQVV